MIVYFIVIVIVFFLFLLFQILNFDVLFHTFVFIYSFLKFIAHFDLFIPGLTFVEQHLVSAPKQFLYKIIEVKCPQIGVFTVTTSSGT